MSQSVYFGGSRNLSHQSQPVVASVVQAALLAGRCVHVGCAIGADQQVVNACVEFINPFTALHRVHLFTAFGPSGAGSWAGSAVSHAQIFSRAGGSVHWWAGGSASVSLVARLMRRSIAGLRGCSSAIFFSPGRGSFKVMRQAVGMGIPVHVFQPSMPALIPGCAGSWSRAQFLGFVFWRWVPAQACLLQ